MKAISKKNLDQAMSIILDFHSTRKPNQFISSDYLYHHGFPEKADAERTVIVLESLGYLTYDQEDNSDVRFISLTTSGIHYFEDVASEKRRSAHDWRIAIFSAIAGALASEPLWWAIHWIFNLLQNQGNSHP